MKFCFLWLTTTPHISYFVLFKKYNWIFNNNLIIYLSMWALLLLLLSAFIHIYHVWCIWDLCHMFISIFTHFYHCIWVEAILAFLCFGCVTWSAWNQGGGMTNYFWPLDWNQPVPVWIQPLNTFTSINIFHSKQKYSDCTNLSSVLIKFAKKSAHIIATHVFPKKAKMYFPVSQSHIYMKSKMMAAECFHFLHVKGGRQVYTSFRTRKQVLLQCECYSD